MNIGFYGHSNCAYRSPDSLIDIVEKTFSATVVNIGVRQGSEERILFELKKTKELDLAIIFHSEPQFIFLPGCDRDIGLNHVSESRADYLFRNWDNDFVKEHHKKFVEKFETSENFLKALDYYKNYYYHPDLQMNRYYGALIQIDQFITAKRIPCIHVIQTMPSWFKFSSGIVDTDIMKIAKQNPMKDWFVNCISREGNILIAERLKGLVEELNPPSLAVVA